MTIRAFTIHGHFYQPPREDPLTGVIPNEIGAAPYKNWNERIHAECYLPNAKLRNFEKISFNVGPTLCDWMDSHHPETCRLILSQDRANVERYGVGNAMAQAYNHTILPLSGYDDKVTQVVWGIADFEHRFGRRPQGFWLPETAADPETLAVLADHGIEFTILAPWQADIDELDPTEPYRVDLPGGKSLTVFFYHSELSSLVSFDPSATANADIFASTLLKSAFNKAKPNQPQIIVIASDGELYGHHKQFRDYFLAHMVNGASQNAGIMYTFPGLWLKQFKPHKSVAIRSRTSWSCHHGVARWMEACGCTPGDGRWKAELRQAFDRLGEWLNQAYFEAVSSLIKNPWELRHSYIQVVLGSRSLADLIDEAGGRRLNQGERDRIALLLRAQYERQRMFTSCGWFFEDFARIEPQNNVAYAAQAVHLTRLATGLDLSGQAGQLLAGVVSRRTGLRGDRVFQRCLLRAEKAAQPGT
jgi:alpha-amylase/alpha-mannosidase (GH57 family)